MRLYPKGRKNGHEKNPKPYRFIHFDNSIKLIYIDKEIPEKNQKRNPARDFSNLDQYERLVTRWTKKKEIEFLEYDSLETLQRLFNERFVNGKRRLDLMNALGLKFKPKR